MTIVTDILTALQAYYLLAPAAFVVGAMVGSFLNVVVYRLPIMLNREWLSQAAEVIEETLEDESYIAELRKRLSTDKTASDKPGRSTRFNLLWPRSHCPHCSNAIKLWHNIPILGYWLVGGQCANCKTRISTRYPLIELATALLTLAVVLAFGATWAGLAACVLTWVLITLALIDLDTQLLPDNITLPFLWLGLAVNYHGVLTTLGNAFLGACLGYLILWSVFHLFRLVTGKDGMGYGDFKMLGMLGAWLGIQAIPLILVLSSLAGALMGGVMIALGRDREKPVKFGPFLAVAGFIALLWGDAIIQAWLELTRII